MRAGHPFADDPTLERYCEMRHLVVSLASDPHGFVDELLASQGRARRVALTVPNFMFALAIIAETDLISALPRRLVALHAARSGVVSVEAPLPLTKFRLNAVAPRVAMMNMGVEWLFDLLADAQKCGSAWNRDPVLKMTFSRKMRLRKPRCIFLVISSRARARPASP